MKKILVIGVLVLGGLWACRKTNLCSYASTLWNKGRQAVKAEIPRQFELDRIANEIDKLDNDLRAMLGPIAERKAELNQLNEDIEKSTARRDHARALLTLTQQVEAGTQPITWNESRYTLDEAKARLAEDFATFKALDASLKSRKQLLAAQQQNIHLAEVQLSRSATRSSAGRPAWSNSRPPRST